VVLSHRAGNVGLGTQDVERPGLRQDLIEDVDVMHFAPGNAEKRGDVAVQIEQSMHLDSDLVLAESGPGKQGQTEVDGGRVQCIQAVVQIRADRVRGIE
jgi:hypothetical protein